VLHAPDQTREQLRRIGLSAATGDLVFITHEIEQDCNTLVDRLEEQLWVEPDEAKPLHAPRCMNGELDISPKQPPTVHIPRLPRISPTISRRAKSVSLRFRMVTTFYPPFNFGGDGIAIQRLARALVRRGHAVTVLHDADAYVSLAGREPEPSRIDDGVQVVGLRSSLGSISPLLTHQTGRPVIHGRRLSAFLDNGTDVTFFHNVSLVGGPALLTRGRGVTLYEAHEHWLVCPTHVLWRHGRERCDKRECLRCVLAHRRPPQLWRLTGQLDRSAQGIDAFIAKSTFSRDKHREFGFTRSMEVIPYFLPDEGGGAPNADEREPSPHPRPYFLFVGRLERIKGLDDVIPSFRTPEGPDLVVAGAGEHEPALRELAGDSPRVRFIGRIPPDELARYYAHAIALIVPSVCYETFGIILIEAFRQGTPVIARRLGPFPETVDAARGGLLFENRLELEDAMRVMTCDPERRAAFADSARRAFSERWSESVVMPQYLELIRRVAMAKGDHALVDALPDEACV
jgi:glycosyltransferase involved in cell wall biosynthesis